MAKFTDAVVVSPRFRGQLVATFADNSAVSHPFVVNFFVAECSDTAVVSVVIFFAAECADTVRVVRTISWSTFS